MTTNDAFGRTLAAWLHEDAEHQVPDHLEEVLARTVATRQQPAWSSPERWLPVETTFTQRLAPTMRPVWLSLVVLALMLAIAAVALFAGARQQRLPAPFGAAVNGALVFEGVGDILTATPDGMQRVLVGGPTNDFSPWFSRDGTRFAFLREEGVERLRLMVADADGGNVRPMTTEPLFQPDWWEWSATGSQLVNIHTLDGRRAISILESDGSGELTTLDLGDVVPQGWVDWRPPDGREILFRGSPTAGNGERALYAIHADGSGLRPIAPVLDNEYAYHDIDIAPDGSRLMYWNWEADDSVDGMGGYTHLLDLVTGVDTLMRFDPTSESEVRAVFSPDGTRILLERQPLAQMIVVPADPGALGVAIGPAFDYDSPHQFDFSPDGLQVVLTRDGSTQVFRISDGASLTESVHAFPSWQRLAP